MLSEYEQTRARNIATNAQVLAALGIQPLIKKTVKNTPSKPRANKRLRQEPTREPSRRARSLPTPLYTPGEDDMLAEASRQREIDAGGRLPDSGLWSGERFGEVPGVAQGKVFGKGDYQRLGRQEMSASGFHQPFVNPEWCAPGVGCYSVIVNNDNGASLDQGGTILYAGSGGRRRGQNRTAPQSCHQEWGNVTNAALRLNHETQQPVRVVRGPKLKGRHGTADSGGGYRYDGLYAVTAAEMVKSDKASELRTAMFTLTKIT